MGNQVIIKFGDVIRPAKLLVPDAVRTESLLSEFFVQAWPINSKFSSYRDPGQRRLQMDSLMLVSDAVFYMYVKCL